MHFKSQHEFFFVAKCTHSKQFDRNGLTSSVCDKKLNLLFDNNKFFFSFYYWLNIYYKGYRLKQEFYIFIIYNRLIVSII